MGIAEGYKERVFAPSDINEHLPTLYQYAKECSHITECGVRTVVSSYAFAHALVGKAGAKLIQVDPRWDPNIEMFRKECAIEGLTTLFHNQSDLECPMEYTDLLFIDTWHVYGHLKRELARWAPSVKKYIVMHDTTVDEWKGETVRVGWDAKKQSIETGIPIDEICRGLWPAIDEFLTTHPEWKLRQRFVNNNGLTILERVGVSS